MNSSVTKTSPGFGELRPAPVVQTLLGICHQEHGPLTSRLLAPLLRKFVLRLTPLPVDVSVGGLNLRCQLTDNYSEKKFLFTPWRYDRAERRILQQYLPPDGVFLDIGANIGLYTLSALQVLGHNGRILAFEPNPPTRSRLLFNIACNRKRYSQGQVTVLDKGVADQHREFVLQLDTQNLGASSIKQHNRSRHTADGADSGDKQNITIHCEPLLAILQKEEVQQVDVIKIDIEGAEDQAMAPYLREAPDRLLAGIVIIENSEHLWQEDIFALLKARGYERILCTRMNSVFRRPTSPSNDLSAS